MKMKFHTVLFASLIKLPNRSLLFTLKVQYLSDIQSNDASLILNQCQVFKLSK